MGKIVKKIRKVEKETVYDVCVEDSHHYVLANGLVSHNSGLKYAASLILFLSKKKEKVGTEVIGDVIHCLIHKSRITKPFKKVDVLLNYRTGLNPYHGMLEFGAKQGVIPVGAGKRYIFPNGKKAAEKTAVKNPEKWFTSEVLDLLDKAAGREFLYGGEEVEAE